MPRFAANLSLLFTEVPLVERFARARAAGFSRVEINSPTRPRSRSSRGRAGTPTSPACSSTCPRAI